LLVVGTSLPAPNALILPPAVNVLYQLWEIFKVGKRIEMLDMENLLSSIQINTYPYHLLPYMLNTHNYSLIPSIVKIAPP
jgi:hypothetical protein